MPDDLDDLMTAWRAVTSPLRLLLVLDDAAGTRQIRPLLPAGPGSRVIVTGRSGSRAWTPTAGSPWRPSAPARRPPCCGTSSAGSGRTRNRRRPGNWSGCAPGCRWRCASRARGCRPGPPGRWPTWWSG
ncbi:hypothetical protein ACFQV4_00465 [Streptomyces thermocarboxydus]